MENYFNLVDFENKENQENLDGGLPELIIDERVTENLNVSQNEVDLSQLISKPFECTTCGYKTIRRDYFKVHLKNHREKTSYSCKYCDYNAKNKKELTDHAKTHLNEKSFPCEICKGNVSFTTKSNLKIHDARSHNGENKPFACQHCKYKTSSNTALQKHMKAVHFEPYGCGICDFSFPDKVSLKDHIWKIHSIQS